MSKSPVSGVAATYWEASGDNIYNTNSGSVNIGTTSADNWDSSTYKVIHLGDEGFLAHGNISTYMTSNLYFDGSTWRSKADEDGAIVEASSDGVKLITGTSGGAGGVSPLTIAVTVPQGGGLIVGPDATNGPPSNGRISCYGIHGRQGTSGTTNGSLHNWYWTGAIQAWIDVTNVGNVSLVSDYRTKKELSEIPDGAADRINMLRPITFTRINNTEDFGGIFAEAADGVTREGFIAHELQAVIPSAVEGEKDDPLQCQSINADALLAVLVKAVQELAAEVEELKDRLPV